MESLFNFKGILFAPHLKKREFSILLLLHNSYIHRLAQHKRYLQEPDRQLLVAALVLSYPCMPRKMTSFSIHASGRAGNLASRNLNHQRAQFHQDEESEEEKERVPVHEEVSGFDIRTGLAISADGHDGEGRGKDKLVIPVTSHNNWRDRPGVNIRRLPRGKNLLPREVQAVRQAEKTGSPIGGRGEDESDQPSMAYGLSYAESPAKGTMARTGETHGDQMMEDAEPFSAPAARASTTAEKQGALVTEDELALEALVRESRGDVERRSDLVIESTRPAANADADDVPRYDETSSFRTDVASRPDSASLDAYSHIPVEEFGAALLRGMGWKEGESIGRGRYGTSAAANKPRNPERRPGFLGIGAKEIPGSTDAEAEIGAWGKSAMRKSAKSNGTNGDGSGNMKGIYMPVMMKNKRTGEYITEDGLADLRKEAAKSRKMDEEYWRERTVRNLERNGRDRDRDRYCGR